MLWPGSTLNLYQRALPAVSIQSGTVTLAPVSRSAFGQVSLSAALTTQAERGVTCGLTISMATNCPCVPPCVVPK